MMANINQKQTIKIRMVPVARRYTLLDKISNCALRELEDIESIDEIFEYTVPNDLGIFRD